MPDEEKSSYMSACMCIFFQLLSYEHVGISMFLLMHSYELITGCMQDAGSRRTTIREQLQQGGLTLKHRLASTAWRTKSVAALDAADLKTLVAGANGPSSLLSPAMQSLANVEVQYFPTLPHLQHGPPLTCQEGPRAPHVRSLAGTLFIPWTFPAAIGSICHSCQDLCIAPPLT